MDIHDDINLFFDNLIKDYFSNENFTYNSTATFTNICIYLIFKRNDVQNVFHSNVSDTKMKLFNHIIITNGEFEQLNSFLDHIINTDFIDYFSSISYSYKDIDHQFLIRYNKENNLLEFLEPNYNSKIFKGHNPYIKIFEFMSQRLLNLRYTTTEEIFGSNLTEQERIKLCFNSLSFHISRGIGFCSSWTLLFIDLITYYENLSSEDIFKILYERNKNKTLEETSLDLSKIIVSYILYMHQEIGNEYTKHNLNFDLESFGNYQENYVYSDMKMYQIISSYFENL